MNKLKFLLFLCALSEINLHAMDFPAQIRRGANAVQYTTILFHPSVFAIQNGSLINISTLNSLEIRARIEQACILTKSDFPDEETTRQIVDIFRGIAPRVHPGTLWGVINQLNAMLQ